MDLSSITAAYEGLKAGKDILLNLHKIKVESEVKERVSQIMSRLGDAQDTLFSMRDELFNIQSENDTLKRTISELQNWDSSFSNYELFKTTGGAVVYRYKNQPEHYICPSCASKRIIEILQDRRAYSGNYRCPGCDNDYPIEQHKKMR